MKFQTREGAMASFIKMAPPLKRVALLVLAVTLVAACSKSGPKAGQSVVKVNDSEITVHQINAELMQAAAQGLKPEDQEAARKKIIDALIDRQLVVDEAIKNKMDRNPEVVQAIERAKAQILAQAYLQAKAASVSKPTQKEIEQYFNEHTDYFSQRKLYDVKEVSVALKDYNEDLKGIIDNAKSIDDVVAWLDEKKVQYIKNQSLRTTADLPSEVISKLKPGGTNQFVLIKNDSRYSLLSLTYIKDSPLTRGEATPLIERYLVNVKAQEAAKAEISQLRENAKIVFLNGEAGDTSNGTSTAAIKKAGDPIQKVSDKTLEKGVSGLR